MPAGDPRDPEPLHRGPAADITHRQDGEALFLYHPDVPTQVLRRLNATQWTLLPVRWIVEPFAEVGHFPGVKLTLSSPAIGSRTFTTAAATAPGAPTGAIATPLNASARVAFTAPASNGGAGITSYTVTSSPGGLTGTGTGSPIVVGGLTNGTPYTFTVTATNSAGTGPASHHRPRSRPRHPGRRTVTATARRPASSSA